MIIPATTAPNNGDANTAIESIMANIPTPISKALEPPERLPENPSIILAKPLNSRAIPIKIIMV